MGLSVGYYPQNKSVMAPVATGPEASDAALPASEQPCTALLAVQTSSSIRALTPYSGRIEDLLDTRYPPPFLPCIVNAAPPLQTALSTVPALQS